MNTGNFNLEDLNNEVDENLKKSQDTVPEQKTHVEEITSGAGTPSQDEDLENLEQNEDTIKEMMERQEPTIAEPEVEELKRTIIGERLTTVRLYKFINDNKIEHSILEGDNVLLFVNNHLMDDWNNLLGSAITSDNGIACVMKDGYICFYMRAICNYFGIKIEEIFPG